MPYILTRVAVKSDDNPCNALAVGAHGVFPSRFIRSKLCGRTTEANFSRQQEFRHCNTAPVENLEACLMQMNGVGVAGQVDEIPNFYGPKRRLFSNRIMPMLSIQQHAAGLPRKIVVFIQS
jgi:hypothetical protein